MKTFGFDDSFCIGCGVCAGVCPTRRLVMQFDPHGEYRPVIGELVHRRTSFVAERGATRAEGTTVKAKPCRRHHGEGEAVPKAPRRTTNAESRCGGCGACARVCPSRSGNPNEDQLAELAFASVPGIRRSSVAGYYLACHAGHVQSSEDRLQRSSGGLTTWLLKSLLERNVVTRVAHVEAAETGIGQKAGHSIASPRRPMFSYSLAEDAAAIGRAAKSAYYPVEISSVIREFIATPGRYAVVGLPCFLKAIRQAMQNNARLRERVAILIGLVCGGTRSLLYADYLCALNGGDPALMSGADFRVKDPQRPSWDYGFKAETQTRMTKPETRIHHSSFGFRPSDLRFRQEAWTRRYFEPEACSYCDDVFAEVADVVFMDAWLDRYMSVPGGTNLVLTRRPDIAKILDAGARSGEIHLEDVTIQDIVRSQQATIELRRTALAERLELARQMGWSVPTKRVAPARISACRLVQLLLERAVRRTSRSAFNEERGEGRGAGGETPDSSPLIPHPSPHSLVREFRQRMWLPTFALKALNYLQARIAARRLRPYVLVRVRPLRSRAPNTQ